MGPWEKTPCERLACVCMCGKAGAGIEREVSVAVTRLSHRNGSRQSESCKALVELATDLTSPKP